MQRCLLLVLIVLMLVVKVWGEPVCEILYFNELKGLPSNHITRIIQDKQGAIWMATWNGFCLYDGYEFHTYKSNDALSTSDRFRNVVMEEDGNFVCAIDDDFFNFNVVSHVFSRLNGVEKEYAKQKMTLHPLQIKTEISLTDDFGTRWQIAFDGRISYCGQDDNTFTNMPDRIKLNHITGFFIDRQKCLWIYGHDGVCRIAFFDNNIHRLAFSGGAAVKCLFSDSDGQSFWMASSNGMVRYYADLQSSPQYLDAQGHLSNKMDHFGRKVYCMDRFDDKLWLGCKGEGVFVLGKTLENILPDLDVYSFECDSLERLWVATMDDGLKVIQKGEHYIIYNVETPMKSIRRLLLTSSGELLLAGPEGLAVAKIDKDLQKMKFHLYLNQPDNEASLPSNAVMSLLESSSGRIYVGTESRGLCYMEEDKQSFHRMSHYQNVILSLSEWDGKIWIVSSNRIENVDESTNTRTVYDHYPYPINVSHGECAPLITAEGKWLVPVSSGVYVMDMKQYIAKRYVPPLVILNASVDGYRHGLQGDTLLLSPDERNLSVQFAALDYIYNENIVYAYRFMKEGEENTNWIDLGEQHSLTLMDICPGEYVLEMRSTDASGGWADNIRHIKVFVEPKFSETVLAKVLLIMVVVVGWGYIIRYLKVIKRRQREIADTYLKLIEENARIRESEVTTLRRRKSVIGVAPNHKQAETQTTILAVEQLSEYDNEFLSRVSAFVEENLSNANATIDDMALATITSKSVLYRKMKLLTGNSPMDFLASARIREACHLLESTQLLVKDISSRCGYTSQRYFSRAFKRDLNMSPSEYRDTHKILN